MGSKEKMKGMRGSKSVLVPTVKSNKGLLWSLGEGQRKRQCVQGNVTAVAGELRHCRVGENGHMCSIYS